PVRPSPCPVYLDGSDSPWASPLCFRTLRYLALAGVRGWPGHWPEHDHESCSLKLVRHRVATSLRTARAPFDASSTSIEQHPCEIRLGAAPPDDDTLTRCG